MSDHPDSDLLAGVAAGEPVSADLQAHLDACPACSADLAGLRHLAGTLSGLEPVAWAEPSPAVWAAIEGELPGDDSPRPARRWNWIALGVAAAIGIVAGVIGGRVWWPAPAQPAVLATTNLTTLDDNRQLGEASLLRTNGDVELSIATQPLDAGKGYLEVWLINTDGKRMVSVGILADNTGGVFPVSASLLSGGYRIVDISREPYDDQPAHSGDSLARGVLRL